MPGLDSDTKLLLSLDGIDEAQSTTDESDSNHTINFNATAQLDTTNKKWGTASLQLDGDSDYLDIDNSADWNISTNFTIDFWAKFGDHDGTEMLVTHYEGLEDFWRFLHAHGQGLAFQIYSGEVVIVDTGVGGEITDTDWHHIALCKVSNEYGVYVGGSQVNHTSNASMDTFTGSLYIGQKGNGTLYYYGYLDEIRIQHSNYFGAAPVAELTNTITVPPSSYARDLSINVHDCTDLVDKVVGG